MYIILKERITHQYIFSDLKINFIGYDKITGQALLTTFEHCRKFRSKKAAENSLADAMFKSKYKIIHLNRFNKLTFSS